MNLKAAPAANPPAVQNPTSKASGPTKPTRLPSRQKELADREAALGEQWVNDGGKWINQIKTKFGKTERVIAEVECAIKEKHINTTPAQYAEYTWEQFGP